MSFSHSLHIKMRRKNCSQLMMMTTMMTNNACVFFFFVFFFSFGIFLFVLKSGSSSYFFHFYTLLKLHVTGCLFQVVCLSIYFTKEYHNKLKSNSSERSGRKNGNNNNCQTDVIKHHLLHFVQFVIFSTLAAAAADAGCCKRSA